MEQENLEMSTDPGRGFHGVLRYRRELQDRRIHLQPQSYSDLSATCEFCGRIVKLFEPVHTDSEDFCCLRYREVFEEVVHETRMALKLFEEQPERRAQAGDISSTGQEKQELVAGEWENAQQRLQQKEMERYYLEAAVRLSSEISLFHTNTISFQLSGSVPRQENQALKRECSEGIMSESWTLHSTSSSGPVVFGLSHHQSNAGVFQKFYSDGNKFLTGLPDGSAQVFYPSGNLAIILLTNDSENVCVVHDDLTPHCPIRALFQSSGRATCYHGNGNVWLSMDTWGGQTLDEGGARTCRWSWSDHTPTPTPLRPIFLSLNQNVGVRVLGRQYVFVTFLASGQQARFRVGSCVKLKDGDPRLRAPPLCKEELLLLACRVYIRLVLTQTDRRPPAAPRPLTVPPSLRAVGRKLLQLSHRLHMEDRDGVFIQHCLQDCQ
ncbi:glutamate-rich protein 6 isoform X2 [Brachyhypopomus gauderio]|uniref:glutamate-rich protein 6 isoform X2 n=1 Tax=Brachyhypopomus gauderio TaxID=698409 RepID=UPI0040420C7C